MKQNVIKSEYIHSDYILRRRLNFLKTLESFNWNRCLLCKAANCQQKEIGREGGRRGIVLLLTFAPQKKICNRFNQFAQGCKWEATKCRDLINIPCWGSLGKAFAYKFKVWKNLQLRRVGWKVWKWGACGSLPGSPPPSRILPPPLLSCSNTALPHTLFSCLQHSQNCVADVKNKTDAKCDNKDDEFVKVTFKYRVITMTFWWIFWWIQTFLRGNICWTTKNGPLTRLRAIPKLKLFQMSFFFIPQWQLHLNIQGAKQSPNGNL